MEREQLFKNRLETLLRLKRISGRELSRRLGKSNVYASTLLNDGREPGCWAYLDLCEIMGISPLGLVSADSSEFDGVCAAITAAQESEKAG